MKNSTAPKQVYAILNYSISKEHIASIHRADCSDIKKDKAAHGASVQLVRASKVSSVVKHWLDADMIDMGYTARDIKILGCAR